MTNLPHAIVSAVIALGIIAVSHAAYTAVLFQINGGW